MRKAVPQIFYLSVCLLACLLPATGFAQETTESEDLIKEKIKERLEKTVGEEIKGIQEEIEREAKKKAFTGLIQTITPQGVILETDFGTREASFSAETDLFYYEPGKGQTSIQATDLEVADYVILMGILEDSVLQVKRGVKTPEPEATETRRLIFGKVEEIDNQKIKFSRVGAETEMVSIEIGKNVPFEIKGQEEAEIEDIQIGDQIFAIVTQEKEVKKILIVPGKKSPLSEEKIREATEEAETSPAATP